MPEYTYRREDGSMFSIRQKFSDEPLNIDPHTGQKVVRVVQPAGIIFKGSGFYVNDSRSGNGSSSTTSSKPKSETKSEKSDSTTSVTKSTSDAAD